MRQITILGAVSASAAAAACSGPNAQHAIARNVDISKDFFIAALACLALSLIRSVRTKSRFGFPASLVPGPVLAWRAIGQAYGGDCGTTAVSMSFMAAGLAIAIVTWQIVSDHYRKMASRTTVPKPTDGSC